MYLKGTLAREVKDATVGPGAGWTTRVREHKPSVYQGMQQRSAKTKAKNG
jgi:hypothetical protein